MSTNDKEMSFLEHLEVSGWHLIRSALVVLFFSILAFVFKGIIFDLILLAPKDPNFFTYRVLCATSKYFGLEEALCLTESPLF